MSTSRETAVHAEFDAMTRKAEQFLARHLGGRAAAS